MFCFLLFYMLSSPLSGPVVSYCIFLRQIYSLEVVVLGLSCLQIQVQDLLRLFDLIEKVQITSGLVHLL